MRETTREWLLDRIEERGLHLLNTTIVPASGQEGLWRVETLDREQARGWYAHAVALHDTGRGDGPVSHVGHDATAAIMTKLLHAGTISVDRTPWDGSGVALALQLKGRIPEGAILSEEEMEAIGYSFRLLCHVSDLAGGDEDVQDPGNLRDE